MYAINYLKTIAILYLKKLFHILPIPTHQKYTPFIILCHGRTGSTLLHTYLNSHPTVISLGESAGAYIKNSKGEMETQYLNKYIYNSRPKPIQAVGFKFFYSYSDFSRGKALLQVLLNMPSLKVIVLQRKNMLRAIISSQIADKTGFKTYWIKSHELKTEDKGIFIDTDECITQLEKMEEERNRFDKLFQNHQRLYLSYEELISDKDIILTKIQNFLKVRPHTLISLLRKQNPESLSELVINYHELKKALQATAWESQTEG